MAVVKRRTVAGFTYRIKIRWQGREVWEDGGHDERAARRLNARRLREVRAGTFVPKEDMRTTRVAQYLRAWLERLKTRSADNETARLERHVLAERVAWFGELLLDDVRPKHMIRLVGELRESPRADGKGFISSKTVSLCYGMLRTMFRDARIAELVDADPCVLPPGTLSRKARRTREPYTIDEVRKILGPAVDPTRRVFAALALFTGGREGEICGRRWRDWDPATLPLGCLTIATQYNDRPLKTDEEGEPRPRRVPVHPELAKALRFWWEHGFELVHCRPPSTDDFIVPRRGDAGRLGHTKSSAYKLWRRALLEAGVTNRSLHSTRHTFTTLCRRGGARKDVLEKITHNAAGDIVDGYTHWDWAPLCEAVLCFGVGGTAPGDRAAVLGASAPSGEDRPVQTVPTLPSAAFSGATCGATATTTAENKWRRRESNSGQLADNAATVAETAVSGADEQRSDSRTSRTLDARSTARHHCTPDASGAVFEACDAVRAGDAAAALDALEAGAAILDGGPDPDGHGRGQP